MDEFVVDGMCVGAEPAVRLRRLHAVRRGTIRLRCALRRRRRSVAARQRDGHTHRRPQPTHANRHQLLRRQPGDVRRARRDAGDAAQGARVHGAGVRVVRLP